MSAHHHREDDAVEHDIVLTDEVHQSGVLILPPFLPAAPFLGLTVAQLLCVRHIADGRIEPHVEHLTVGTLHRNRNTPVKVACHGAGLQIHVEPTLTLSIHIRSPLLMLLENPLLQPLLILVQGQIPVLRLLQHGRRTRDGRFRIDELGRREVTTAFLALVAIGTLVMTVRALTCHVTVGQELLRLLVVELCSRFLRQLPLIIEFAEPFGGKLMMRLRCCSAVYIERDTELLEALLDHLMVAVHHILRSDTLLTGTNRDGHTMLIRTTNKQHLALLQS